MGKGTNTAVILLDVEPRDGRSPRFLAHDDALQLNRRRARNEDALEDGLLRIIRIALRHRGHLDVRYLGVRGRLRLPLLCLPSAMAYAAADANANEDDANGQTNDEDEEADVVLRAAAAPDPSLLV